MDFLNSIGSFISNALKPIAPKVTGAIESVGSKVGSILNAGADWVDKIPIIGDVARPFTGVAREVGGVANAIGNVAGSINKMISNPTPQGLGDVITSGRDAIQKGRSAINNTSTLLRRQ